MKTYKKVIFTFFILNKDNKIRFFKESFLSANIRLNIVFEIFFLITKLVIEILFLKTLCLTSKKVKLIEIKEFVAIILNSDYETLVIYIAAFNISYNLIVKIFSLKDI